MRQLNCAAQTLRRSAALFAGRQPLPNGSTSNVKGLVDGISLATANQFTGLQNMPYTGRISGPGGRSGTGGLRNWKAGGNLNITPAGRGVPVSGNVEVAYDQSQDSIQLGASRLTLPSSRLDVSGTLGASLKVQLESRNLGSRFRR